MRQQYTPIFRSVLSSRVWALSPAQRCVWMWLQLHADPEGYICADVTGVALGARVTGDEAREALELLALTDADAEPDDPYEGRIIERVPKGWRVLNYEEQRDLAKREARNARNRRYMRTARSKGPANDTELQPVEPAAAEACVPCVPTVAPPKPKPKSKPKTISSEGDSPLPPVVVDVVVTEAEPEPEPPTVALSPSRVLNRIPATWQPSESLRADAVMAGVPDLDERIQGLREGPIGGKRGVFEDQLENYIRKFFPDWRVWGETKRAKALPDAFEVAAPKRVKGYPLWVRPLHVDIATASRLDLKALAKRFAKEHHIPPGLLKPNEAAKAFEVFLTRKESAA